MVIDRNGDTIRRNDILVNFGGNEIEVTDIKRDFVTARNEDGKKIVLTPKAVCREWKIKI